MNSMLFLPLVSLLATLVYYADDVGFSYAFLPLIPAAIISAAGALGAAGLSAGAGAWSANKQEEVASRNQLWQSEENEKNRKFQHNEWLSQFNATNEYNDPARQVQRLAKAGISPAATFGSGAGSIGQSMASPTAPSGASTSVTSPYVDSDAYNPWRVAETLGSAMQKFASLPAKMRESSRIQSEIENLSSQSKVNFIDADARKFELDLRRLYGNDEESQKLFNSMMQYNVLVQTARKYSAEANNEDARKTLIEAESAKERALRDLHGANKRLIEIQANYYGRVAESEIRRNIAAASEFSANASVAQIEAKVKNASQSDLIDMAHEAVLNARANKKLTRAQVELVGWLASKAEKENDLYKVRQYVEMGHMIVGDLIDGVGQATRLGILKGMDGKMKRDLELKEDELNYKYGSRVETEGHDVRGRKTKGTSYYPRGSQAPKIYGNQ